MKELLPQLALLEHRLLCVDLLHDLRCLFIVHAWSWGHTCTEKLFFRFRVLRKTYLKMPCSTVGGRQKDKEGKKVEKTTVEMNQGLIRKRKLLPLTSLVRVIKTLLSTFWTSGQLQDLTIIRFHQDTSEIGLLLPFGKGRLLEMFISLTFLLVSFPLSDNKTAWLISIKKYFCQHQENME